MSQRMRDYREMADPPDPEAYTNQVRFGVWDVPLSYPEMRMGWRSLLNGKLPGDDFIQAVKATMLKAYAVESAKVATKRATLAAILLKAISELERYGKRPETKSIRPRRVRATKRQDRSRRRPVQAVPGDGRRSGASPQDDANHRGQ